MSKLYDASDLIKLFTKLEGKFEDLKCFVKECCAKIPVNIGTGIGIFKRFNANKWEFKSLLPGNNISITETAKEIVISSTTEPIDCNDIKDCIGISNTGDPDKFLNEQGDYVIVAATPFNCSDLNSCSTDNLPEGLTNLYFTDAKAITALTGQNISIFNNDAGYLTNSDINGERKNDFVDPYSYCGSAPIGSLETDSVWTVYRIECFIDGSVVIMVATNIKWTDRLTAIYT
jgi:hypothetical protein